MVRRDPKAFRVVDDSERVAESDERNPPVNRILDRP